MKQPDQLALPHVFDGPPDPRPKPQRRKSIDVQRKPPQMQGKVLHPQTILMSLSPQQREQLARAAAAVRKLAC